MSYAFAVPTPIAAAAIAHSLPLLWRTPTQRLVNAREDHERCLQLAASYRVRLSRGEYGVRGMHDWAIGHARTLRLRFPGLLSASVA